MRDDKKIIVLAHARTGSTSLMHVLNLHPEIRMCHEPFHESHSVWYPGEDKHVELVQDKRSLDAQLEKIFQRFNGLKTLTYQLPENLYEHLLLRDDVLVVYLGRRNILQAAVSGCVAHQTKIWQASDRNQARNLQPIQLEPIALDELGKTVAYMVELDTHYQQVLSKKPNGAVLRVFYEDLYGATVQKNLEALGTVFGFLGLDVPRSDRVNELLDPAQTKVTSSHVLRLIPNATDIDRELGCEKIGWLLRGDA